jgi:hypothetical protein
MKLCALLCSGLVLLCAATSATARPGTVTWSDGKKVTGDLTLTPGKQLKIYAMGTAVELPLAECQQIRFTPEKEEQAQGFFFPNAGQATIQKTGEIYPVRYIHTQITLPNGKVLDGHLFTTVLYVQNDAGAQKAVLEAKQTGADGQKIEDLPYITAIDFTDAASGESTLDLTKENIPGAQAPVVLSKPDLSPVALVPGATPLTWTLPAPDPTKLVLSVQGNDGFHVSWPALDADPLVVAAVQTALKNMQDFYDTRTLLGTQVDDDDGNVSALVMLSRKGVSYGMDAGIIPWSLVVLHFKYDDTDSKVNLINRSPLGIGRASNNGPPPPVLKSATLLGDITAPPAATAAAATTTNAAPQP